MGSRQSKPQRSASLSDTHRRRAPDSPPATSLEGETDGKLSFPPVNQLVPERQVLDSASAVTTIGQMTGFPMSEQPQAETEELRQQLEGKNELIAALVAELEQVVEQLDRVKRSGADRGRSGTSSGGALPAEVVEEHQHVLGELQRVVQQWEEMQAISTLGRIESELTELRSMLASGAGFQQPAHDEPISTSGSSLESVISQLSLENSAEHRSASQASDWEAMKRQMLGNESEDEGVPPEQETTELSKLLEGIATPTPIDFENSSLEALKRACIDRDTYIVQLTRWVRTHRSVQIPENLSEIQVSEELQQKIELMASRLEEQVRLAEVEMSLERARLSREKSQVQADRAVMEKHLKRLGISSLDELEDIAVSSSSSGDRRWMRFLGVNRKS